MRRLFGIAAFAVAAIACSGEEASAFGRRGGRGPVCCTPCYTPPPCCNPTTFPAPNRIPGWYFLAYNGTGTFEYGPYNTKSKCNAYRSDVDDRPGWGCGPCTYLE
jgi:hypothetical protein